MENRKKFHHIKATMEQRAGQFLPFNALVGYYEMILKQKDDQNYELEYDFSTVDFFPDDESGN